MVYPIISSILLLLAVIGIPWGILIDIKARGEQDLVIRKKMHRKALYIGFGPFALLFVFIFLHGIITALIK